jgi:septal ring factor EnvC (AmiA/AmiB activator)
VGAGERIAELEALVARLEATVAELTARNAELEARLGAARRAGKRQAAPFSKGAPKPEPKSPGRRSLSTMWAEPP